MAARIRPMPHPETPGTQRALLLEIAELKRQLADQTSRKQRSLQLAIAASLLLHVLVALIPQQKPRAERPALFGRLAREIEAFVAATAPEHPWTCTEHRGTDGSHVFRGGAGHSLVIDPEGRLWRARNHEDFETTWDITPTTCVLATLTPLYGQMREYLPR